jgi:hypothetical protein
MNFAIGGLATRKPAHSIDQTTAAEIAQAL